MSQPAAMRRAIRIALAVATLATGCRQGETGETSLDRQLASAFESNGATDTLSSILVARQRRIFTILLGEDRRELTDYIAMGFRWNPPRGREPTPFTTSGDATYYAMLGDFLPRGLSTVPTAYGVESLAPGMARVFAELEEASAGVVTFWENGVGGWKATQAFDVDFGLAEWQALLRAAERMKRNR
jgi:hypothetical protein